MNETICNVMLFGGIALAVVFAVIAVILFVKTGLSRISGTSSIALTTFSHAQRQFTRQLNKILQRLQQKLLNAAI